MTADASFENDGSQRAPPEIRQIYLNARAIRSDLLRGQYLDRACHGDPQLRAMVDRLLDAISGADEGLLDQAAQRIAGVMREDRDGDTTLGSDPSDAVTDREDIFWNRAANDLGVEIVFPEIDGYEIMEVLGEGGMGTVFLARQSKRLQRPVAVKVIKPGMDSREVLARFELEKQTLASLSHPGITRVYDAGLTKLGHPFFSMELVPGTGIDAHCQADRCDISERLRLFQQACDAIHHAHLQGVIHRDLKPSNVMVATVDGRPVVKVIDFGVAKICEERGIEKTRFTKLGHLVGTPLYMSPEQVDREVDDVDARSDVYSMGGVLYRLLTGEEPFDRSVVDTTDLEEVRRAICESTLSPPSGRIDPAFSMHRVVRGDLDRVTMKALQKDRELRYASIGELSADIGRYLAGQPVRASLASPMYRLRRFLRRHRTKGLVASAFLVVVAAAVAVVISRERRLDDITRRSSATSLASQRIKREKLDILEASALQQKLIALAENDFATMTEHSLPRTSDGRFLGEVTSGAGESTKGSPSLRRLLHRIENPLPMRTFVHPDAVVNFDVSPDHEFIVTTCLDRYLRLWRMSDGKLIRRWGANQGSQNAVDFSPDGKTIVSGDSTVLFWPTPTDTGDPNTPVEAVARSWPAENGIETLRWSPDGRFVAAAHFSKYVRILNTDGTEAFRITPEGHGPSYDDVLFSEDGREIYVPDFGELSIEAWDLESRSRVAVFDRSQVGSPRAMTWARTSAGDFLLYSHFGPTRLGVIEPNGRRQWDGFQLALPFARSMTFLSDRRRLVTGHGGGVFNVQRFDPADPGATSVPALSVRLHSKAVSDKKHLQSLPENRFVSAAGDRRVNVWDADRLSVEVVTPLPPSALVDSIDGIHVHSLVTEDGGTCDVMRTRLDGVGVSELLYRVPIRSGIGASDGFGKTNFPVFCVNQRLAQIALVTDQGIDVRDLETGELVSQVVAGEETYDFVSMSEDGSRIAAIIDQEQIVCWELDRTKSTWRSVSRWPAVAGDHRPPCLLLNDVRQVVSYAQSGIELRDFDDGRLIRKFKLFGQAGDVDPDGHRLAEVDFHVGLTVVDLRSGRTILSRPTTRGIRPKFCDSGRLLLMSMADGPIDVLHLPTGRWVGEIAFSAGASVDHGFLKFIDDGPLMVLESADVGGMRARSLGRR